MDVNYSNEPATLRIQRLSTCNCPDCIRRRSIAYINELIVKADKRLKEENSGITDSWKE